MVLSDIGLFCGVGVLPCMLCSNKGCLWQFFWLLLPQVYKLTVELLSVCKNIRLQSVRLWSSKD